MTRDRYQVIGDDGLLFTAAKWADAVAWSKHAQQRWGSWLRLEIHDAMARHRRPCAWSVVDGSAAWPPIAYRV